MRVAVIGAGMTGLVAARELAIAGDKCDVYERWPGLGGQVATIDLGIGEPVERYYHHLFTTDVEIQELYRDLGMESELEWRPSSVAVFANGRNHPFTTPLDLLRFRPLPLISRIRMGAAVLWLQRRHTEVEPFEHERARDWVTRTMGAAAWDRMWGPLLRGKFGGRCDEISMAWLWSKLTLRRRIEGASTRQELLGYPSGSWQPLLERLRDEIEGRGGSVLIDRPVAAIDADDGGFRVTPAAPESFRRGLDPREFEPAGAGERYDAVLATVPTDIFAALLSPTLSTRLAPEFADRLDAVEYHAAICLLLDLERPFSDYYWTNVADPEIPFVGVIEHTNFVEPERYGGHRLLYVANYVEPGDPLLELDPDALLDHYEAGLRRIQPEFSRSWVRSRWLFREPHAQPIVTPGYRDRMPPLATGPPGLVLANTTQIYPEDRGTNYSVRLAHQAVTALREGLTPAL